MVRHSELLKYLREHKKEAQYEGSSTPRQQEWFMELLDANPHIQNYLEIGFNRGTGSLSLLNRRETLRIVSFDIGRWTYTKLAYDYLVANGYGERLRLILGNSNITVPKYRIVNPTHKFDLVFVDGGHKEEVSYKDLVNCRKLASPECLVVIDDIMPDRKYGIGPYRAWQRAKREGLVREISTHKENELRKLPNRKAGDDKRVWALGEYL